MGDDVAEQLLGLSLDQTLTVEAPHLKESRQQPVVAGLEFAVASLRELIGGSTVFPLQNGSRPSLSSDGSGVEPCKQLHNALHTWYCTSLQDGHFYTQRKVQPSE